MTHVALAITGASGAIYATRTLAALLAHGCTVDLVISDYGKRLLRDELGPDAAYVTRLTQRRGRPVVTPRSPPIVRSRSPSSSNSSVGKGPDPTRVV